MSNHPIPLSCAACEAQLMDYLDSALSQEAQLAFEHHIATCDACRLILTDAQRGAAWLEMLKAERPEPSADLMNRIIAQTSGAQATLPQLVPQPAMQPTFAGNVLPFRSRWSVRTQPRLAMTAAMAFFSLALSANLLGFGLGNLRPGNIERGLFRAQARAIQLYDNLRVVADLQSSLQDIKRITAGDDNQQPEPAKPTGSSQRQSPQPSAQPQLHAARRQPSPALAPIQQQGVQA